MGGGVHQPGDGAVDGVEALSWVRVRYRGPEMTWWRAGALSAPATRTRTRRAAFDEGEGEAQARRVELGHGVGHHEALDFGEGGRVREEASGMAVGAHTEQESVEARDMARARNRGWQARIRARHAHQQRRRLRAPLRREADEPSAGLRPGRRERVEEGVLCHAVVAVGRGGRHAALVAPENLPAFPVEVCAGGQGGVDRTGVNPPARADAKEARLLIDTLAAAAISCWATSARSAGVGTTSICWRVPRIDCLLSEP